MKKVLWFMACGWTVVAVILYFASLNHLDSDSARVLGVSTTINIQGTVFCAACAVIAVIHAVGAIVLTGVEENLNNQNAASKPASSSSSSIADIAPMKTETRKKEDESERNARILKEGGWKCTCGRVNHHYVSTCSCGVNKRELLMKKVSE